MDSLLLFLYVGSYSLDPRTARFSSPLCQIHLNLYCFHNYMNIGRFCLGYVPLG